MPPREFPEAPPARKGFEWRRFTVTVVAMLPPLIAWILKVIVHPRPFWVYYFDPEAIYFYGGLHLLRGSMPANVDNPGTLVHLISAAIAAITGATPLRYEAFLVAAHTIALVLTLGAIVLLLRSIVRDAPPLLQIAVAWTYFLAPQALERIDIWSPEAFYFPLGVAMLALLWRWCDRPSARRALAVGIVIGIAIGAKWVFVPCAVAAVVAIAVARRFADTTACAAGAVAAFVVLNLPLVTAWPRILHRLATAASANPNDQSWVSLLASSRGWLLWFAAIVVMSAATFDRRKLPLTVFAFLTIVLTCAAAWRNPSFRYLLPAAIAVVALFALAATSIRRPAIASAVFALATLLLMSKAIRDDARAHWSRVDSGTLQRARIEAALPPGVVVYGWRAPTPSFALSIMTDDPRDLTAIAETYPREGHYDPWRRRLFLPPGASAWDAVVVPQSDLSAFPGALPVARVDEFVIATRSSGPQRRGLE
jgi:hypothetical protein